MHAYIIIYVTCLIISMYIYMRVYGIYILYISYRIMKLCGTNLELRRTLVAYLPHFQSAKCLIGTEALKVPSDGHT